MRQTLIVSHQHQRGVALLVQFEQQVADTLASVAVQVAGGFVGKQYVRVGGKRAGDGDPLLFASRQLTRRVGQALAKAYALKQVASLFAGVLAAFKLHRQHDVFQRIEAVEQLE